MGSDILQRLVEQHAMIEQLASDSRRCAPGCVFFAYPGETADGRRYIADALARGASAVVWESEGFSWDARWQVPNTAVAGLKQQAGWIAHDFYGRPSEALWVCGVTGTNGKTSCTQWIAAALESLGVKSGVIGTLGSGFPGALDAALNTTPDVLELHALLARMRQAGALAVAMEASSHGLAQGRTNGVAFDCALFTNLSHDHLDYHGSMDAYGEAKAMLFDMPGLQSAVLNLDDILGVQLAQRLAERGQRTIGYALSLSALAPGVVSEFVAAREVSVDDEGMSVSLVSSWGDAEARINQLGRFNVSNALGVLGCLLAHGVAFERAVGLLAELPPVSGRMQRLAGAGKPLVVVDYAHTPDALERALDVLRPLAKGRLLCVFGCGGDRDPSKRPQMGEVARRLADRVILTDDNPRSEDPAQIVADILSGIETRDTVHVEHDRATAIRVGIVAAGANDLVLVAGKGHEDYQEVAGQRLPFSDIEQVWQALQGGAA